MKKIALLFLAALPLAIVAQSSNETEVPIWYSMIQSANPDPGQIEQLYQDYYANHLFEKNTYTQAYKHFMMDLTRSIPDQNDARYNNEFYEEQSEMLSEDRSSNSSWTCVGPFDFDKEANGRSYACGAAHIYTCEQSLSNPNILYAGSANAGVWKSIDKGLTWIPLTANMMIGTVKALEIDRTNPNIVYFGGGGKIYKTTDGGLTWNITGNVPFQNANFNLLDLVQSPVNTNILWFAAQEGLFYTNDAGANWNLIDPSTWMEIEINPGNPSIMYAIKQTSTRTEFYKSTDGGATFTIRTPGWPVPASGEEQKRTEIATTPAAPNIIYAYATGAANGGSGLYGIYVSHDAGESWSFNCCGTGPGGLPNATNNINLCGWNDDGSDDGGQYYYDLALEVSPFDSLEVHACAVNHWVSYDGGVTFTCPAKWSHSYKPNYIHADIHDCHFYGNDWWWACDGGIFYSHDGGDTIMQHQNGIAGTDFWGFGKGEWDGEDVMVGGTYHNGTLIKDNNVYLNGWVSAMGGDNILGSVNYGDDRRIIEDYGQHILPGDRTQPINSIANNLLPSSSYVIGEESDLVYDPHCYNTIYLAKDAKLWKSVDGGTSYSVLHDFQTAGKITAIEIGYNNPQIIYVVGYPGYWNNKSLYKSTDGGQTFSIITPPSSLFNNANLSAPFDIAINPFNENEIYLARCQQSGTYANLNGYKIFKSNDGGATWVNLSTPMLDGEYLVNIEFAAGTDGGVYLGTRRAVYYRNNTLGDWQLFNNNLPLNTLSINLSLNYKDQQIVNATNRSVYTCNMYEPSTTHAIISVDKTISYCVRDTFRFVDHSIVTDSNTTWLWSFPGGNPSSSTLRKPKVTYAAAGTYDVTLTVTDAFGTSTQNLQSFITVYNGCDADTIPGNAMVLDGNGDYASLPALNLNSNSVTLMAWIKPIGTQNDWGGIVFSRSGNTTAGISIKSDNEIRYHWNNSGWSFATGLHATDSVWTHVALVITPNSATVYVNGIPSTNNTTILPEEFDGSTNIGVDDNGGSRFFKGMIDEVCIYNRSLSQNEIRDQMHLTKKPTDDSTLVAYYQFNETGGLITDRVGTRHASLVGDAHRIESNGPFGGGLSSRLVLTAAGTYTFGNTGLNATLPVGSIYPGGEVVVSRINVHPNFFPDASLPSRSYWIADNYGSNLNFTAPTQISFDKIGNITTQQASNPNRFHLFFRDSNSDLPWGNALDSCSSAVSGIDGSVTLTNPNALIQLGQFIIMNEAASNGINTTGSSDHDFNFYVNPNPVTDQKLILYTNVNETFLFTVFNEMGQEFILQKISNGTTIQLPSLAAGNYFYRAESNNHMFSGSFVVLTNK